MHFGGRLRAAGVLTGAAAMALAAVVGDVGPAGAHSCAEPVTIDEGAESEIQIAVTIGDVPTSDVTFQFDGSFEIVDVPDVRGWEIEEGESSVRYVGGTLNPETCVPFQMVVRADASGSFRVRALQTLEDGQVVEHPAEGDLYVDDDGVSVAVDRSGPANPAFEQVIYVNEGSGGAGARGPLLIGTAVGVLIALALVLTAPKGRRRAKR